MGIEIIAINDIVHVKMKGFRRAGQPEPTQGPHEQPKGWHLQVMLFYVTFPETFCFSIKVKFSVRLKKTV